MRFRILGSVQALQGDRSITVGGPQQRALLALLLLSANRVVPVEHLIAGLWGDQPPGDARSLLRGCVARLRRALSAVDATGQSLMTHPPGYLLRVGPGELDLDRFEELTAKAHRLVATDTAESLRQAAELLTEALALWRGPALSDIELAAGKAAAAGLEERRLAALEERFDIDVRLGRYSSVIGELQQHVAAYPLRERPRALLMVALYRGGRQAEALAEYAGTRRMLVDELGIEPGPELQRIHQAILTNHDEAVGQPAPIRTPTPTPKPRQLPPPVRHFAGRSTELAALAALLDETAADGGTVVISAIAGLAGVGKTALAVHYGHRVADRFPDGQLYINLRGFDATCPAVGPAEAVRVFLDAFDVAPERIPADLAAQTALYRSLLAGRRMLVILDNARDTEQVRPLVPGSPGCLAIVTSRNQLSSLVTNEGAHLTTLDVLSAPDAHRLLTQRLGARRVAAEPDAVAEIIARCAGLPLALALVASRATRHAGFPLAALADELRRTAGSLDAFADPEPTTDIRAVFACSYQALSPGAARVFRLVGLHPGTDICADAVAALAGLPVEETRTVLAELTHTHLMTEHAPGRFNLHDLLRVYAAEQARAVDAEPEREAAVGRLLTWYWYTADAATCLLYPHVARLPQPRLDAPTSAPEIHDSCAALRWLDTERRNLLAVGDLAARAGPRSFAWLLSDTLRAYFSARMYTEDWLAAAGTALTAANAEGDAAAQAAAEFSLGSANRVLGRYQRAIDHYTRALDLARRARWTDGEAPMLGSMATTYLYLGRLTEAVDMFRQALARCQRTGDLAGAGRNLMGTGLALLYLGRLRDAADHLVRAMAMFRRLGSRRSEAITLLNLGVINHDLGRIDTAFEHLARALDLLREVGDRLAEADALRALAAVHCDIGDHRRALELAEIAVGSARDTGNPWVETDALNTCGAIEHRLGRHESARDRHQSALALARRSGASAQEVEALVHLVAAHHGLGDADKARRYGEEALAASRRAGYRLLEGLAVAALAAVELDAGGLGRAADLARQAIVIQRETGHRLGEARALVLLGHTSRLTDPGAAEAYWRQAYDIFADAGTTDTGDVRALLCQLRAHTGRAITS
ncbi:MAG TPA: BTAD domain-containing putative transcriptional regulator [Pilimelia sp.]|nr:BTAD domain-containing putative transcriptional regulator [Pilimelia sp.]